MIPPWFRVLARLLPARSLPIRSRPARRTICPRLEALEMRAVTSTLHGEAPGVLARAPETFVAGPGQPTDAKPGVARPVEADDEPGLDHLIIAIRSFDTPIPGLRPNPTTGAGLNPGDDLGAQDAVPRRPPPRQTVKPQEATSEPATSFPQRPAGTSDNSGDTRPTAPRNLFVPSDAPGVSAGAAHPAGPHAGPRAGGAGPAAPDAALESPAAPATSAADAAPGTTGAAGTEAELSTDGMLLQRFVSDRDETAFAALVRRHERLVLGVCQRVLGDSHAAQDALQATFLVLARRAAMLDQHRSLASWLYKVAYHLALRLRAVATRRRHCERGAAGDRPTLGEDLGPAEIELQELRQALREELQRLPERYRLPLVLCYIDGRTHDEAARAIGMPRGSIAKRIGEALQQLRERLTERGISL